MNVNEFIGITVLLFALANPIGVIPIFLDFVQKLKSVHPKRIIIIAASTVAGFLIASALLGEQILTFFNVGLNDFRIAGGLLALFIAFEMFQACYGGFMQTIEEKAEAETEDHGIAVTPLAFPLLVGPAEMSIMITLSNDMPHLGDRISLIVSSLVASVLIALILWMAVPINRILGKTGINVATRVIALVVATIGIKFIMTGIRAELPGLSG